MVKSLSWSIRESKLYDLARSKKDLLRSLSLIPKGATVLVHVGKCGGRSLRNGIENATRNPIAHVFHVQRPVFRADLKYVVVARGPISRLASAFRWRYKLVVLEGSQRYEYPTEYDILVKYGSLSRIAEDLYYPDGSSNSSAQRDILKIHHIRENLSFYLSELLRRCRPAQIEAVLMQENLDEDILRVFGYANEIRAHDNRQAAAEDMLSDSAEVNLRRFFHRDFEVLMRLYAWGKIDRQSLVDAI